MHSEQILELLDKNATLITVNTRLAEYFQEIYAKKFFDKKVCSGLPLIFSYDVWIEKIWHQLRYNYHLDILLINAQQSHVLWEEVIQTSNQSNHLFFLNTQGIINEIKKAWKLCWSWKIDITKENFSEQIGNVDTVRFYYWASCYLKKLKENGWIDIEMLPAFIKENFNDKNLTYLISTPLIIAGFDRLSPNMSALFSLVSSDKPLVYENSQKTKHIYKAPFLSENEEIEAFTLWAKKSPDKKIACVMFNLADKRKKLDRLLQRYFNKEEYNISAGYIFSECTMINQALSIFDIYVKNIQKKEIILKDFYFILNSRFFGENEDILLSEAMQIIHQTGNASLSWESFIRILKQHQIKLADKLEQFLAKKLPQDIYPHEVNKPSVWATFFQELLEILNWPGIHSLDINEYQTYERWILLLEEYKSLDLVIDEISVERALFFLKKMAGQIIFQSQKNNARVHFLGPLEVSELRFDAIWVMGMNEEQFPSLPALNPFIPQTIQRQHKTPHSTHEVEMHFAHQLMKHFQTAGKETIFSYLSQREDSPALESPLIKDIPFIAFHKLQSSNQPLLETFDDSESLPCDIHENIQGGTTLIKNQALCPFRAFAKHRLNAVGFELLETGLNDRERGNLTHNLLEIFWKKVKTQAQLLSYSADILDDMIHKSAWKTVEDFCNKKPNVLNLFFKKLETQRLEQVLKKWIEYEKTRPAFSIVALEKSNIIKLGGLELRIRTDRIDELVNGDKIVIDYKTGTLPSLNEYDERPENPQLLLYALSDASIKAWAFAQVKPAEALMKGRSAEDINISGIKKIDWDMEYSKWERILIVLAEEFLQGKHSIDPKQKTTCNTCDLQGLCRVQEKF